MPAELLTGSFTGAGGDPIHWRAWPVEAPAGQVVVVHGYGEHGDRYARLAARFNAARLSVWAPDHRGHGRSGGPRGLLHRLDEAVADVDRVVDMAHDAQPDGPLFLFAHSMGGAIGLRYALDHQERLAGLVLSAPPVSLTGAGTNVVTRRLAEVVGTLAPRAAVHRIDFANLTRDEDELRRYLEDPLVHRGAQPARTVAELLRAMARFPSEVPALRIPLLVMHGTADRITHAEGSREVFERAGSTDKRLILYDGFFHELHNEPPPDRERAMGDVVAWLEAHTERGPILDARQTPGDDRLRRG